MSAVDLELALETARRAAQAAADVAMPLWRSSELQVETKADETPVTIADKRSEDAILAVIAQAFPEHDVLAEETGLHERGSAYRWIVDPLDGTRGFARGSRFWGPLVALMHDGDVLAGSLGLPALDEVYCAARGLGAWRGTTRLQVSDEGDWSKSTLSLGELNRLLREPFEQGVNKLCTSCASARAYGDLAAITLVLEGQAEAYVEGGVKVWDLAPMKVLVEEAGGRFTDLDGGCDLEKGHALASNGRAHDTLLAAFA